MDTDFNLKDVIRMGYLSNRLVTDLLEELINVGGDRQDLEQLVGQRPGEDRTRKKILRRLATSMTAEELWKIADQRVDLGRIRSDGKNATIPVVIDPVMYDRSFVDSIPAQSATITHSLFHDDRANCLWKIHAQGAGEGSEFAGWLELLAYGEYLESRNVCLNGYEIFGLGSHFPTGDEKVIYPRLCQHGGYTSFNWIPYKDGFMSHSRRRFYLVRHSSASST